MVPNQLQNKANSWLAQFSRLDIEPWLPSKYEEWRFVQTQLCLVKSASTSHNFYVKEKKKKITVWTAWKKKLLLHVIIVLLHVLWECCGFYSLLAWRVMRINTQKGKRTCDTWWQNTYNLLKQHIPSCSLTTSSLNVSVSWRL